MNVHKLDFILEFTANHPASVCDCGHTGDGGNSQHQDTLQKGHGACLECDCAQFSWAGWIQAIADFIAKS